MEINYGYGIIVTNGLKISALFYKILFIFGKSLMELKNILLYNLCLIGLQGFFLLLLSGFISILLYFLL